MLAVGAGVPFPSFVELEAKDKVRYVALTGDEIAALRLAMPELTPSRIPAGTYPSGDTTRRSGCTNFAMAHAAIQKISVSPVGLPGSSVADCA